MIGYLLTGIRAHHVAAVYIGSVIVAAMESLSLAGWVLSIGGIFLMMVPTFRLAKEWYHFYYKPRTAGWEKGVYVVKLIDIDSFSAATRLANTETPEQEFRATLRVIGGSIAVGACLFIPGALLAGDASTLTIGSVTIFESPLAGAFGFPVVTVILSGLAGAVMLPLEIFMLSRVDDEHARSVYEKGQEVLSQVE